MDSSWSPTTDMSWTKSPIVFLNLIAAMAIYTFRKALTQVLVMRPISQLVPSVKTMLQLLSKYERMPPKKNLHGYDAEHPPAQQNPKHVLLLPRLSLLKRLMALHVKGNLDLTLAANDSDQKALSSMVLHSHGLTATWCCVLLNMRSSQVIVSA